MASNHPSYNARLKVKRANSHIDSLISDSTPLSKKLYEITNTRGAGGPNPAQPDAFYLRYQPKQPIVDHFRPIIGDVVNNLREAMDYWINNAVSVVGPPIKGYFPFASEWKDLKTSPHYPLIEKIFPDLAHFIWKEVKPCRDTNLHLWAATSLCNQNKHNDFVPVVTFLAVSNINARIGSSTINNLTIKGDANAPYYLMKSGTPMSIDDDFSVACEITFPQGAIFARQAVIPTLLNMSEVVVQTLDALDNFIAPYLK